MTIIGPSLIITGELTCHEEITIHGQMKGQMRIEGGSLLVGPSGTVDADVHGTRVTIHGTLAGNVAAAERIELTATARVSGTLMTPAIVLQDGATFNGQLDVERPAAGSKGKTRANLG